MFEAINEWISTYMETPYYQRTVECECLFYLAIAIYSVIVIAAIVLVWIIAKRFKKFVDKAAEREAKYKEEEK